MEAILSKDFLRQFSNLISVILALTVNVLASALPLNGQNTGEISDRFQVFFVPAGYVFTIWFLIFVGWIAFAIFQFLPAQKDNQRLRNLGYWFALSGVFNAAWLFLWRCFYDVVVFVDHVLLISFVDQVFCSFHFVFMQPMH